MPPGSPNPDPIFRPKMSFPHPFSDLPPKIHIRLPIWRTHKHNIRFPSKNFVIIPGAHNLKIYFEITYNSNSLSYLLGIETTNSYVHALPSFPGKPCPIPDQNRQSLYSVPVFRSNGPKIILKNLNIFPHLAIFCASGNVEKLRCIIARLIINFC